MVEPQELESWSEPCHGPVLPLDDGPGKLKLVENIGLEPIKLESCKDSLGALPIPHINYL